MICYGLATRFGDAPFMWHIQGNLLNAFFANSLANSHKREVTAFCDSDVKTGDIHYFKKDNYHFSILKTGANCCIVAADCALTPREMAYIALYLLDVRVSMNVVATDLEKYTKDVKIEELTQILKEINVIMTDNIAKIITRGEHLETLLQKTDDIAKSAEQFKHGAEKLNTCWPSCTLL